MVKINRRQLILFGTASVGTIFFTNKFNQNISSQPLPSSNVFDVYKSSNGLLELDLEAKENLVNIGNTKASLLTYNGKIPAPRLEVKPGDKVRIHFTNSLSQPTNIHYHGLHIPIQGNADNVFLHIKPKEKVTYQFQIPNNHLSGTFWYHPHLHGFVAEQLFGGLAGLFIVRGDLDEIPEIKSAKEEFLVLQDFAVDSNGRVANSAHMSLMTGREGNIITVNGQVNPRISFPETGLLRLRILNASPSRFYRLALENHSFYQIATDGGGLNKPIEVKELLLTPGQRAEVLIKGNQPAKEYRLLNLPYNRGGMGMMGGVGMMGGMGMRNGDSRDNTPMVLATVNYESSGQSSSIPNELVAVSPLPEPQTVRTFELNHGMNPSVGMAFLINGLAYRSDRIHTQVRVNTVEDWEIINTGVMDHPLHIHNNAFQVISRNGKPEDLLAWRDTVLVKTGETVRIRIAFRDFVGKTVYHCHILDHEDLGMMGNLMING
ncbi:multicopper oxidase family protein [Cyanobacterium sp. Dongsha4]|uniref:multicopper oxidase family protein n=1 Tax=Cyanobacterium sp. DS4 TaxID=2878255 RepID=UPI002E803F27|nr:multicopper oxidase family protein [Cyanobacterium sp. Dongsha4]WVK99757.1 multicopper oxidase family protein [Cyanobacterium sp. Dongsha4]